VERGKHGIKTNTRHQRNINIGYSILILYEISHYVIFEKLVDLHNSFLYCLLIKYKLSEGCFVLHWERSVSPLDQSVFLLLGGREVVPEKSLAEVVVQSLSLSLSCLIPLHPVEVFEDS